jgi:sugar lactone lactonase YvrE
MKTRSFLRLILAALTGLALVAPLTVTAEASPHHHPAYPDRIDLPDGFLPEGIAIGPGPIAYFGSRADGDIYAADLRTGQGAVFSQGPGTPSIGLKSDQRGTLYVAGGPAGTGRVVSARTGAILASYQFATGESFVNDVVLTKRMAWFTDSRKAQLYGIPLARHGVAAPGSAIVRLPLKGDWVQTPGVNNANGIAQTPDRSALLVVKSNTGQLFRVDPRTGNARVVDLGGYVLTNGDGLLVEGRTLYGVQNRLNRVALLELNRSGSRGELVRTLTDPDFDVPTTVGSFRRSLYLPNARFGITSPETAEYWVTRIDKR